MNWQQKQKQEPTHILFDRFIHKRQRLTPPDDDSMLSQTLVDVAGLLSKECFDAWLASRLNTPKNPQEAFRKAVTSHIRGVEGMRPFDPDIELALVELLRKKQIWPCFKETGCKIGSRGLQLRGYWESQANSAEIPSIATPANEMQGNRELNSLLPSLSSSPKPVSQINIGEVDHIEARSSFRQRRVSAKRPLVIYTEQDYQENGKQNKLIDVPFFLSILYKNNELLYGRKYMHEFKPPDVDFLAAFESFSMDNVPRKKSRPENPIGQFIKLSGRILDNSDSLVSRSGFNQVNRSLDWKDVLSKKDMLQSVQMLKNFASSNPVFEQAIFAVLSSLPQSQFVIFFSQLFQQNSLDVFSPRHLPLKPYVDERVTYFFSKEFCLPRLEDRSFTSHGTFFNPVGMLLGDMATYTTVDVDEPSRKIYRGSIVGMQSLRLRVHKYQGMLFLQDTLDELFDKSEVWTRSVEYRCDGTVMVLLNRYFFGFESANSIFCQHQDITEKYLHVL